MGSTISSTATNAANTVISSTGIGSGLDIGSIVSALTTAAGAAQNNQLSNRKTTLTTQQNPKALAGRTAALADDAIATASATSSAVPAQYSLSVQNLATAASLSSKAFAGANAAVGTGTLSISIGGNTST